MSQTGIVIPDMQEVSSKNMHSVGYDGLSSTLFVRFRKKGGPGALYRYSGVPVEEHDDLLLVNQKNLDAGQSGAKTESLTGHFNARIKSRPDAYPFEKVEDAPQAVA